MNLLFLLGCSSLSDTGDAVVEDGTNSPYIATGSATVSQSQEARWLVEYSNGFDVQFLFRRKKKESCNSLSSHQKGSLFGRSIRKAHRMNRIGLIRTVWAFVPLWQSPMFILPRNQFG